MKSVAILGLGYIGLPTALLLAAKRIDVLGVDINHKLIGTIQQGICPLSEGAIQNLFSEIGSSDYFRVSLTPDSSDVYIICVPTPFKDNSGTTPQPDTDFVFSAVKSIIPHLRPGNLLIIESTCPIGTTESVSSMIISSTDLSLDDLYFAYCPERVLPGNTLFELAHNDRIIGGINEASAFKARDFYRNVTDGQLHLTDARSAEFVKLAENSYRDVNIAFANELSILSDHFNRDVYDIVRLANYHPRVNILSPSCGVGGHCISVDPWFLASASPYKTPLIQQSRSVNDHKADWVVQKIIQSLEDTIANTPNITDPIIGILGLTYKQDVDDLRNSPALYIAESLVKSGYRVMAYDPFVKSHPTLEICPPISLLKSSHLSVYLVAHSIFNDLPSNLSHVLDFCGITHK